MVNSLDADRSRGPRTRVAALKVKDVFRPCPSNQFDFKTSRDIEPSHDIYAQSRATRAIQVGLGISHQGYNIYVSGSPGTGKSSVIKKFLEDWSQTKPIPQDWIYVHNFSDPESPIAISMPTGEGRKFKKSMEKMIRILREELPIAMQGEDYENTINAIFSSANEHKSKLYSDLEKLGKSKGFLLKSSKSGIETIPIIDGRPLTEKDYSKISDEARAEIEHHRSAFEPEILDFVRKVRAIDREAREHAESISEAISDQIVSSVFESFLEEYQDHKQINDYLVQMQEHVTEHLADFHEDDVREDLDGVLIPEERDRFTKYKVNLLVDHSKTENAPVIIETNPTYYNLFGKVEKSLEHGMYSTDFTMIKPGALHKANGGYLVLNALDIFRNGNIWDTLKRVLKNNECFIEDIGEQHSLLPTSGLRPATIPLDLKLILVGTDDIYHILYHEDEEFARIFKIKADFDYQMERNQENVQNYASFIATRSHKESLLPFDRSAICAAVEYGSRLVDDQNQLSLQFSAIKDLSIEANFIALEQGSRVIKRSHMEDALNEKYYRLNLYEEQIMKLIEQGDIITCVDGEHIGAINGLVVSDFGDYAFGKIGRITCTHSIGDGGIINIERQSKLSGRIHDKGVFILSGLINTLLSSESKHNFNLSLCFEQSYGPIDGDSASVAEFICMISSLANLPIKQNLAVTGSINQLGHIQPVGGINEKIEGFYRSCVAIGESSCYHVLIPIQNQKNLMLHQDIREAVRAGKLKIYPVRHVAEAFFLATGCQLGVKSIPPKDHKFDAKTALGIIQARKIASAKSKKKG